MSQAHPRTHESARARDHSRTHAPPHSRTVVVEPLTRLAAHYLLEAKREDGLPLDPVARFHLGNGARLERINWRGDLSPRALERSLGFMINYLYDLDRLERNHEAYVNHKQVVAARAIRQAAVRAPLRRPAAGG